MLFEFKIINDEIFNVDTKKVNNIKNKCILHFDKDTYKDKELFITFINKVGYSRTIILGKWREVISCDIPPHVLNYEYFKIFCYTKDLSKTKTLKVYNKLFLTDIDLLIQRIDKKVDNILYENGELKCYSNNILIETVPIYHADEEMIKDVISNHLSQFKSEINEQLEDYITEEDLDYLIISL